MNYSNSQRAGVILYLTALIFGAYHNYVGIHFCKEGRIEREIGNEFLYLMPDDCLIILENKREKKYKLPLKHYHGISIGIDIENVPPKFTEYIGNDHVDAV